MFGGPLEWTGRAVLLAEVLQVYESSLCGDCSLHSHIGFDPLNTGHVRVDDSLSCLGCEALQNYRENNKDMWPGTKLFVVHDLGVTDG